MIRLIHSHRVLGERSIPHQDRGCRGRGGRPVASNRTLPGEPEVRHFRVSKCLNNEKEATHSTLSHHLSIPSHLIAQLCVFAHEVDGEGVVVLAPEHVGATRLPEKRVASRHPDRVPEVNNVNTTALG